MKSSPYKTPIIVGSAFVGLVLIFFIFKDSLMGSGGSSVNATSTRGDTDESVKKDNAATGPNSVIVNTDVAQTTKNNTLIVMPKVENSRTACLSSCGSEPRKIKLSAHKAWKSCTSRC